MNKFPIFFIISLAWMVSYGQNQNTSVEDSLFTLIQKHKRKNSDSIKIWSLELLRLAKANKNDSFAFKSYKSLSYYHLRNRTFDSVKKYDNLLLSTAKKIDSFKIVSSYQNKAAYYNEVGLKDSAMYVLKKAQKIGYNNLKSEVREDSIKKIKSILFIETAIVKNYFRDKEFNKALDLTYSNLSTSNKYGITNFHAWNYFYLGLINLELGNYNEAEKYYLKELEYSKEKENPAMIGFALMHLGNVYYAKESIPQAKQYYLDADALFEQNNYLKGKLQSKKKMFSIYEEEHNFKKAINIGEEYVREYLKNGKQDDYLSAFYIKLGRIYHKDKQPLKGNNYINIGLEYASQNPNENNVNLINQAYTTYKEIGDYKLALINHEKLTKLRDSLLLNENFTKQLAEANTKFEVEKKNNEILTQKLELEQKDREKNQLLYIISGIVFLTLLLGYFLYKRKQQLKTEQKKYISELNRSLRLQTLIKENTNNPQKINGIDDPKFKTYLLDTLNINEDLFDVYVELVKGKSYEDVANTIHLSLSGTKTRINKLYEALKMYSDKDLDEKMTKSQSIKIFNDLLLEYQLKK